MSSLGTTIISPPASPKANTAAAEKSAATLAPTDAFLNRHLGPNAAEADEMTRATGFDSLEALITATVPASIRMERTLNLPAAKGEHEALQELREIGKKNKVLRSFIGMGYHGTVTPPVIQRNIFENPGWYTAYTPYQAEIAQGRMEALLNFQTMIVDLTGLDIANASLLDEATAAAEAMGMAFALKKDAKAQAIFVSENCHPQTIEVVRTRAEPLGIKVIAGDEFAFDFSEKIFAVLLQYPDTRGTIHDYSGLAERAHAAGAMVIVAADILSLTLIKPPGEFGADIAVGSTQRFGVPLGYGGPHAAYMATRDEFKRQMPGRLVGISHDAQGNPAYRLSLQTREQHIRRDKATSNICTAQVLLAVMASMYAVYHGPEGLKKIAERVRRLTLVLSRGLVRGGDVPAALETGLFFDTLCVKTQGAAEAGRVIEAARRRKINLRDFGDGSIGITLDETTSVEEVGDVLACFGAKPDPAEVDVEIEGPLARTSAFLTHPVFNKHHTETEMLRYVRQLEAKDLSLCHSMIPLGSCTMKLNATSQMLPVTWFGYSKLHPFVPLDQAEGYQHIFRDLEEWLGEITGFAGVSLQPNAGSQGEYAGLLAIRKYHESRGEGKRNVCLIPTSAHGTNPASAVMAGFRVVAVKCEDGGDIDLTDLRAKAEQHKVDLACLMVTYPSTHGVFEETIGEICGIVHAHGGQVYMDGANMNAQVGLCRPGDIGADVCHLNLHKTFCIPHGGGGPGMGPIGVAKHLVPFLPSPAGSGGLISAAPWGSASILVIPWMYIRMMGADGLTEATKIAILNANYIARRLDAYFPVLYKGKSGLVAHECILDLRDWKSAGIEVEDVAKRLMDYGFHAPTISWPVPGTMMIEPTESESKEELDRFCDAMIAIHGEIKAVESGAADKKNNVLKNAPHTAQVVISDRWDRPYSRESAAYPAPWTRAHKFWPAVGRIDNVFGDRNLICSCPPVEDYGA